MSETRKLTTILAADVVGYSRLAAADEERTLARLRALRSDLIDPAISIHHGRVVKRTGDGILVEFRSPVEAVRCAIEVQDGMAERNAGLSPERRIEFRVGVHVGDVVEEADGDLMGDAVNIAARIEGIAEPGGIYVSRAAHEQIDGKITERFTDLGDKELKNIPKPVRIFVLAWSRIANVGVVEGRSAPPRFSIIVLPFANIGGDPEQEYFVDGVTESLTTDLSRISGSFVIARNTAFTFKGKPVDVKQIGRDLNVRHVLEGSVQKGGNRLRVNVQLIDTETGNHLWAERFDKPVADLFDMQDEIVAHLASQLDSQFIAAEARRAARSASPDAMDLYFQGMACVNRGWTPENLKQARSFFQRALTLDSNNVAALIGMAYADLIFGASLYSDDRLTYLDKAEATVTKALSAAPENALAHFVLGRTKAYTNRAARSIGDFERALTLDRNLAAAHESIGIAKAYAGRPMETEAHVKEALRLSPRDTHAYVWMGAAGIAKLVSGAYDEAASWMRRSIEVNRNYPIAHFVMAAALARIGNLAEARLAVAEGLRLDPAFTIKRYHAGAPTNNEVYLAGRELVYDGMRKAGVPEG